MIEVTKIYYLYERGDIWKRHVSYFKNMDKKGRKQSLFLTIFIILALAINVITSIYFLSLTKPAG